MKGMTKAQSMQHALLLRLREGKDLTSFAISQQARHNQPSVVSKVKAKSHKTAWRIFRKDPKKALQTERKYPVMFNRIRTLSYKHSIVQSNDGGWHSIK